VHARELRAAGTLNCEPQGLALLILSALCWAMAATTTEHIWRLTYRAPALPDSMKPYERFAAKFSHISFYVLMIGTPLAGWALVSASTARITTKIFKTLRVPDLPGIERSEAAANFFTNMHECMGLGFILLLLLHISAALKHHFVDRDRVLIHMLPKLKQKQPK